MDMVMGHLFLLLMVLSYYTAGITAQMALTQTNFFALTSIRYAAQALVAVAIAFVSEHSLRVRSGYAKYAIGAVVLHTGFGIFLYVAMSSMPVGNTEALFFALYSLCLS